MFICLVVVVVPEDLSYPAELGRGRGEGHSIGFFVRKEGELEEAIHINYKHRQVLGRLATFFLIFTSNVEQNISVCRRNFSVISQH